MRGSKAKSYRKRVRAMGFDPKECGHRNGSSGGIECFGGREEYLKVKKGMPSKLLLWREREGISA